MRDPDLPRKVLAEIEPVTSAMGFTVVELAVARRRNQTQVHLTVYRPGGVGIEDCAAISRNVHPRLEIIEELGGVSLEVSSPGIGRLFKNPREFMIFKGRAVQVLLDGETEWRGSRIRDASADGVTLEIDGQARTLRFTDIRKARLEESEEAGE